MCSYSVPVLPLLISGHWKVEGNDGVSHETLYQWIWNDKVQNDSYTKDFYKNLKHGCRRRKKDNYYDSRGFCRIGFLLNSALILSVIAIAWVIWKLI